jgi:uncharacterized protein
MRRFVLTVALVMAAMVAGTVRPALAAEAPIPPAPTRFATDNVGFVSPSTLAQVNSRLAAYEQATGHQVVLWIGDSIGGADISEWSVRAFEQWKPGRKGVDDGVLVVVLAGERKIWIEVGYGLEGDLPDALAKRVVDGMTERLRAGDRDGAIRWGMDSVLATIDKKPFEGGGSGSDVGAARTRQRPQASMQQKIFLGVVGLIFLVLFITNPRLATMILWSIMSSRGGGGYGGGGGGGGGFGGGGGRSGGGGAGGSW